MAAKHLAASRAARLFSRFSFVRGERENVSVGVKAVRRIVPQSRQGTELAGASLKSSTVREFRAST
jgi:hypothetical protein